jgi:MFS family permease
VQRWLRVRSGPGDFTRLWIGETVSLLGSEVTTLALPLAAVVTLGATPTEVGVLGAAKFAPFLLFALPAGVWVDRLPRRPVILGANAGSAAALGAVPVLAATGALRMSYLLAIAFLAGTFGVVLNIAFWAYVPGVVEPRELIRANGRLMASASAASVGGPGLGGVLVQLLGAPGALLFDAVSFAVAGVSVMAIRRREPPVERPASRSLRAEMREGLRFVFRNPYLRAFAGEAATFNLFVTVLLTALMVYAVRDLHLGAGLLGAVLAVGAAGIFAGSLAAPWVERNLPLGRSIVWTMFLGCWPYLLVPLATGPGTLSVVFLATGFAVAGVGIGVVVVLVSALRQQVTPPEMMGRMYASYRFIVYGTIAVGSVLGGVLGSEIGLLPTLAVGAAGIAVAPAWIVLSPIGRLLSADEARAGQEGAPVLAGAEA